MVSSSWLKLINDLPLSSELLGSPRGFYASTLEWVATDRLVQSQLDQTYTSIYSKNIIARTRLPKTVNGEIPPEFQQQLQTDTPEIFIVTIPEGRAWSDCAIITPDDRLLADISKAYAPIERHPIFQKWKLRPASYIKGTVVVLAVLGGGHNYYHWMFEVLPRLSLLFSSNIGIDDIDYFFLNNCKLSFQQETLAMLGIPMEKVIECNKKSHIKARQLIVPSLSGNTFDVPAWVCNFLRSNFLNRETKSSAGDKRIYVSRTDAAYRKLLNEREVIDF
jgi:Glycosyltransferase 61